jgi:hypothetical protein
MIKGLVTRLRQPSVTSQTPGSAEVWRNDLAVIVVVVLAFVLGFVLRNIVRNASTAITLGDGLPTLRYPAGWVTSMPASQHFQATDSTSASSFDTTVAMEVRALKPQENLELARAAWALQRSRALVQYRELGAEPVTVLGNQPALLITYGYIADPTRENGNTGLPVVVQAQDLLFVQDKKLVVVTVAADVHDWLAKAAHFQLIFASVQLNQGGRP